MICNGCGWEYPDDTFRWTCRYCHTKLPKKRKYYPQKYKPKEPAIIQCALCGEVKPIPGNLRGICSDCRTYTDHNSYDWWLRNVLHPGYTVDRYNAIKDKEEKRLVDYTRRIEQIQKPYSFLTEKEWLAACRYFNGCALCGSEHISARAFFIPFSRGGKYCAWNVIPVCDKCTKATNKNPFSSGFNKEYVERIVQYMDPLIEEAIACTKRKD